jgi:U3 small nucleolar RNA-associated protein 25
LTLCSHYRSADFLSSIEIIIADQLDVMQMQNWEHVQVGYRRKGQPETVADPFEQFIFERLNQIPKEPHGCDFARVKPWYLDGQAAHLRQTILFSAQESPELRSLFSKTLVNVAGKTKTEQTQEGVLSRITPGVKQSFTRFEAGSIQSEDDDRFKYFTTKVSESLAT